MTYFTYNKMQYTLRNRYSWDGKRYCRSDERPFRIPSVLSQPYFMPSYLVRTSDMKVIKGSEVQEGYCALSYSWNQSGEIIRNETTGDMERADKGKHKIIYPARRVRKKPRGRKRIPRKVKFVKFEGLIQEMCKDFNIKYIWYDQMCIDQEDEKKKREEIHQMHRIYSNAYCTVALVPEIGIPGRPVKGDFEIIAKLFVRSDIMGSQWMKRMWTLEETLMSPRMLIVGRNVHFLKDYASEFFTIFDKNFHFNASTLLHYAHTRTSTKDHDHVFALGNIFPDIMQQITVDYKQDSQALMTQFYGLLAREDLSILCFGSHIFYDFTCEISSYNSTEDKVSKKKEVYIPIQKYDLPSWTGVNGEHDERGVYKSSFKNYTVDGRILQVICRAFTNDKHGTEFSTIQSIYDKLPPVPQVARHGERYWSLVIRIPLQGSSMEKFIDSGIEWDQYYDNEIWLEGVTALWNVTHFLPMEKMDLRWIPWDSRAFKKKFYFGSLTEPLQNSAQYAILAGVPFTNNGLYNLRSRYPVVKKEGDYYKVIGMCEIENDDGHFFDDFTLEEQTFKIH